MPRPQTKVDLIEAATNNYDKLLKYIDGMTKEELDTPFDFSDDVKKKEAHWKRDKNLRDVLVHLDEWHKLMIKWVNNNKSGIKKPFLMEGYNWKTYGDMNLIFYKQCQSLSLEDAMNNFKESHDEVMALIDTMDNEELFSKGVYDWTGGNAIGSYFVSVTSSHYDWAMKKLKAHAKNLKDKAK